MFVNPQVPLDMLPNAEDVRWHALHPRFIRCLQVKRLAVAAATLVVFAGVCTFLIFELELPRLWSFLAVGLVAGGWVAKAVAWPLVDVPRRGYAVRDKDILYKSGVLWRSAQAVPFNRIQHAVRGSGPVERGFGLASVTAYTAGGSGGDLRIAGLGEDVAERLRIYILGKLGDAADQDHHGDDDGTELPWQETDAEQRG